MARVVTSAAGRGQRARAIIAAVALAIVAGCARPPHVTPAPAAEPEPAPLRVGTSSDYAPFSTRSAAGEYVGFDVEIARAYAADRGRTLVFVPFRWPELAARLAAGDFDVVMSGVTVRPDRLVAGHMTATVARSDAVLVTHAAGASAERGAAAFDRSERTVAVNRGGHLEQVARARFPHARIATADDNTALPDLLARGTADAIVTDTAELAAFEADCRAARLRADAAPLGTAAPLGAAAALAAGAPCFRTMARLARDDKAYWLPLAGGALAADLDAWLAARERSGWLPAVRARLLPTDAPSPLPPAAASLVARVRRRLSLMPAVAAAKRAAALPIEDRAREAIVERDAAARAAAAGLDADRYVAFVRVEIAAAKAIQRATPADAPAAIALADLRGAINRLDARIVLELAASAPLAVPPRAFAAALADDLPGLTRRRAQALAAALRRIRPVAPTGRTRTFGSMVCAIDAPCVRGGGG